MSAEVAVSICDVFRRMRVETVCGASLVAQWELVSRAEAEPWWRPSEELVVDTATRLIGQAVADMREAKGSAKDNAHAIAHVVETLNALDMVLGLQPAVGPRLYSLFSMCDGPCAWLATHYTYVGMQPLSMTLPDEVCSARLPLTILLRCSGADNFSGSDLLELYNYDILAAVMGASATLRSITASVKTHTPPPGTMGALARGLYTLTSPHNFMRLVHRAGIQDTGNQDINVLSEWQTAFFQCITLSLIQVDIIPLSASVTGESDERSNILAAMLSILSPLVAQLHLSGTGRLLGRHLASHSQLFTHRMVSPLIRRLMSAAEGADPSASISAQAARKHLRTVRWLLYHSPELRPSMWASCSEWLLRVLRSSTLRLDVAAAALAAVVAAGNFATPIADALKELGRDYRQQLYSALVCEAAAGPLDEGFWRPLEMIGLWDSAAWEVASVSTVRLCEGEEDLGLAVGNHVPFSDAPEESHLEKDPLPSMGQYDDPQLLTSPITTSSVVGSMTSMLSVAPPSFRCSIDGRICREPCRSPKGFLFERSTIERCLRLAPACPISGTSLVASDLTADINTRDEIAEWLKKSYANF